MKKYTGNFNTVLYLDGKEAEKICRLGQGKKCCPFVVAGASGFECWRYNYPSSVDVCNRMAEGTMKAKGNPCSNWDKLVEKAREI